MSAVVLLPKLWREGAYQVVRPEVLLVLGSFSNSGTQLFRDLTGIGELSNGGASYKSVWMQCALKLTYIKQFALVRRVLV